MRCDLHVHSIYSGPCTTRGLSRICKESYSQPEEVYAHLKRKGMDLVTLTDHDSIDGADCLRRHPDFFVSEEVTCTLPSGTLAHIGVYDLNERQHVEIQRRRGDLASLLAYLSEQRLFFSVNHAFSSLTGRRTLEDFRWFEQYFPAFETQNGQMLPYHNREAQEYARRVGKVGLGGSDAHVVASAGNSYTDVAGARTPGDFFRGLRAGAATIHGGHGGYLRLTRDILFIAAQMVRDNPATAVLLPLAPAIPLVTLAVLLDDFAFARRWSRRLRAAPPPSREQSAGPHFADRLMEEFAWQ